MGNEGGNYVTRRERKKRKKRRKRTAMKRDTGASQAWAQTHRAGSKLGSGSSGSPAC